jgi:putative transcriptional regulator
MAVVKVTPAMVQKATADIDWKRIEGMSDADIARQAAGDPDVAPIMSEAQILSARVKAVRGRLGLSQPDFARRFGLSIGTVRDWEQGRRMPEGAARVLLRVIEREPDAVARAVGVG